MLFKKVILLLTVMCLCCAGCEKKSAVKTIQQDEIKKEEQKDLEKDNRIKITDVGFFKGQDSPSQKSTTFTKNSTVWMAYDIKKISYLADSENIAMRQDLIILNPSNEIILSVPGITNFKDSITKKPNLFTNKISLDENTVDGIYTVIINVVDLYTLHSDRVISHFKVSN